MVEENTGKVKFSAEKSFGNPLSIQKTFVKSFCHYGPQEHCEHFRGFSPYPAMPPEMDRLTFAREQFWAYTREQCETCEDCAMNSFWRTCRQKHWLSRNLSRPKVRKRRLWSLIPLLALVVASSTLTIALASNNQVAAQYAPVATSSTNPWQYASFPVENFQQYTSGFGPRRAPTAGASTFHNGLDLAAPLGSYIRNWWHGTVVEMSDHTGCGTMVRIQSGPWQHTYCHLMGGVEVHQGQRYLVDRQGGIVLQQGQQVVAGMRIGRVGMTGRTTGPHLHWELRHNGVLVDPALVLQAMYGGAT